VAGVGLLLVLGLAAYGYTTYAAPFSQLDLADRLAAVVVPLLAVVLLGLLARSSSASVAAPSLTTGPGPDAHEGSSSADPAEPAPDPALEPTWAADAAAGAAWTTAGEAASGRPATGWGTPAGTGWEVPRALEAPEPDEHRTDAGGAGQEQGDQGGRGARRDDGHPWGRPAP